MGIIKPFTSPADARWQGYLRSHHIIFLVKNIILIPFIILVIVDYVVFKGWWEGGDENGYFKQKSWEYAPYAFWLRIGWCLIPDLVLTIVSLVLILNPLHHSTYSFHPIFALITSFIMFALYANISWVNWIVGYGNEIGFYNSDTWMNFVYAEMGFQVAFALCYFVMFVYGCVATHRWRVARKTSRGVETVKMGRISEGSV